MELLTAEDVLNKEFQPVKFREGYDQVEVDDFLDEVVATIYVLNEKIADLEEKLQNCEYQLGNLSDGAVVEQTAVVEETVEVLPDPVQEVAPAQEPDPVVSAASTPQDEPGAASAMLSLAQRLHDEYVDEGKEEASSIISEAQAEKASIIADAKAQRDGVLAQLQVEQSELENSINDLRSFESEYRASISDHLEKLLETVQETPSDTTTA